MKANGLLVLLLLLVNVWGSPLCSQPSVNHVEITAMVTGIVYDFDSGDPINGAKVQITTHMTYSIFDGSYMIANLLPGTFPITAQKAGYDLYAATLTVAPAPPVVHNIPLLRTRYAPGAVEAVLNPAQTAVEMNWQAPSGLYELIFDDGVQDDFTIWASGGNQYAVRFTALNYPVTVTAGKVHIGVSADYPNGFPTAPFQVQVYDATGTGGTPGSPMGGPVDVTPGNYGWVSFAFGSPVAVSGGDFFLVMTQGGNPPAACGLAIDETNPAMRSWTRFVTGGGSWLPAAGNFMIRVTVTGTGGPLDGDTFLDETHAGLSGDITYPVWRLKQGEEGNQNLWNYLGTASTLSNTDNGWPSLPCGPYRWAVKAQYPGNRFSEPVFSNAIGKCWTAYVTVYIYLTCAAQDANGTVVHLENSDYDSTYTAIASATGIVNFPAVYKGTYLLTVSKPGYTTHTSTHLILGDAAMDVTLLQVPLPPSSLQVDPKSLHCTWSPPNGLTVLFSEDFNGNFQVNQWTPEPNWTWYTAIGNPAPSAMFSWTPVVSNYSRSLSSQVFPGPDVPEMELQYDLQFDDFGSTGTEHLSAEIRTAGGTWSVLKDYVNNGDLPWMTETIQIGAYAASDFQIRFRAWGENSFNLDYWYVDNVTLTFLLPDPEPCILSYVVYLDNVISGFTQDTVYNIPGSQVEYGQTYSACVKAVYGSGYSAPSCFPFTSTFLWPPANLQGQAVECIAYLTWLSPILFDGIRVPAFHGSFGQTIPDAGPVPTDLGTTTDVAMNTSHGNRGSIVFGATGYPTTNFIDFDVNNVSGATVIAPAPAFVNGLVFPPNETNWAYGVIYGDPNLYQYDRATGVSTAVGSLGVTFNDITVDPVTGIFYGTTGSHLYSFDPAIPNATDIGLHWASIYNMIGIACDGTGALWGYDIATDLFYSINKITGTAAAVGSIGFDANYAQCMFYDQAVPAVTMAAFNASYFGTEIRQVDVTSGASVVKSNWYGTEITGAALPVTAGGCCPPGLIGYKVYREGIHIALILDCDSTWYYDFDAAPGLNTYTVSAWYDLTDYGFPGQYDESMQIGPVGVTITCCCLPFCEAWESGSFAYNGWSLDPASGSNWSINTQIGNPLPCADFVWMPVVTDYSFSLQTRYLDATPYACGQLLLDFDWKLVNQNTTGTDSLLVELFHSGSWHEVAAYRNTGSVDWTSEHLNLSDGAGKAFKVRFRAAGSNSSDIQHWYIDNICIYGFCSPPYDFQVLNHTGEGDVTLTWSPPDCTHPGPPAQWLEWDDGTNFTAIGWSGLIPMDIAAHWEAEMINHLEGGSVTKIAFFPCSSGIADYRIRVWEGPEEATMLLVDQPVPTLTLDEWNVVDITSPVMIDVSQDLWIGVNVDLSAGWPAGCDDGPAIEGYGNNLRYNGVWYTLTELNPSLDYNWNLAAYVESVKDATNDIILGYDLWRSDDGMVTWTLVNTAPIADTVYLDQGVPAGRHFYYATAIFESCESVPSNIDSVDLITVVEIPSGVSFLIGPNPGNDIVKLTSAYPITRLDIKNYLGQTVFYLPAFRGTSMEIDVSGFSSGVYIITATTSEGIWIRKLIVSH